MEYLPREQREEKLRQQDTAEDMCIFFLEYFRDGQLHKWDLTPYEKERLDWLLAELANMRLQYAQDKD